MDRHSTTLYHIMEGAEVFSSDLLVSPETFNVS